MLFSVGIKDGYQVFFETLNTPRGQHKPMWEKIKRWYEAQTEEKQDFIRFVVWQATVIGVGGLAVHFDGAQGFDYVNERPGEFSVALNIYRNIHEATEGLPEETIPICPTSEGEDVHDLLFGLVDEEEARSQ